MLINLSFPILIFGYCLAVTILAIRTSQEFTEIKRMTIRGLDLISDLGANWQVGRSLSVRDLQSITKSAQHFFEVAVKAVDLTRSVFILFAVCTGLLLLVSLYHFSLLCDINRMHRTGLDAAQLSALSPDVLTGQPRSMYWRFRIRRNHKPPKLDEAEV